MTERLTTANTPPDIEGVYGKGWRARLPTKLEVPDHAATLGAWIIYAPNSHPVWPYVMVAMIHLRDIPGVKPAIKYFPEATHEIVVYAMNPDDYPPPIEGNNLRFLTPVNFVGQMEYADDDTAKEVLDATARDIVAGYLNPDTDGREMWIRRFGDAVVKKT